MRASWLDLGRQVAADPQRQPAWGVAGRCHGGRGQRLGEQAVQRSITRLPPAPPLLAWAVAAAWPPLPLSSLPGDR